MTVPLFVDILQIHTKADDLCRKITADNPEFFGIPEANEHYASGVLAKVNFAAMRENEAIGLLSLEFPYDNNANLYWMGVSKNFHRKGVGKELLEKAKEFADGRGATTMTVETLAPSECDENYLRTYHFYAANGFKPLFNLKPAGYEWNMVYMVNRCLGKRKSTSNNIKIRELYEGDIGPLVDAFACHHGQKPKQLFETYLQEQVAGKRQIWVAYLKENLAGYVTLNWLSHYQPFLESSIPEIMDLNVLPPFRRQGIGSKLLDRAEKTAAQKSPVVGIGVGLYDGYGDAQKLYVKRGYIPDGLGPTYRYTKLDYGQSVMVDDDLVLWFTKRL